MGWTRLSRCSQPKEREKLQTKKTAFTCKEDVIDVRHRGEATQKWEGESVGAMWKES